MSFFNLWSPEVETGTFSGKCPKYVRCSICSSFTLREAAFVCSGCGSHVCNRHSEAVYTSDGLLIDSIVCGNGCKPNETDNNFEKQFNF